MQRVLVLDSNKAPLMPCHPARARELLTQGKAAVYRRYPFTIILTAREGGAIQPVTFKVDPGSKQTGIALVADFQRGKRLIWVAILEHRGEQIKAALLSRRQVRRSRRSRHTRYRPARFNNRRRAEGWLPPSLQSRVDNIWTWGKWLYAFTPITSLSMELVKFDTQLMQNAEISGMEYQQGELAGYEIREYLLEKWGRKCAYCGVKEVALEVEHITPKSRGGSNRVSNLTLACHGCNQHKRTRTAAEFGHPEVQQQARHPLKDAAVVNITRWALYRCLQSSGLPVEVGTGGQTKFNRTCQGYPKAHWIDAACVGVSGAAVDVDTEHTPLSIAAAGRQSRQMCRMDRYGFPRTSAKQGRVQHGFQTGDMVQASVTQGKKTGSYSGRVAVRSSGNFNISTAGGTIQGIHYRYCQVVHQADGYHYTKGTRCLPTPSGGVSSAFG